MIKKRVHETVVNTRYRFRLATRRIGFTGYEIHQISLPKKNLIYIPIPKNACSSLKHALYYLGNGKDYDYPEHREWGYQNIHDFYSKQDGAFTSIKELKKQENSFRFAVVRDPVHRFLSCYRNRILDLGDLKYSKKKLRDFDLTASPDLNTFVKKLGLYRKLSKSIRHHTDPQSAFLGGTVAYLDEVYPIEKMEIVSAMLKKFDDTLTMTREKSQGPKVELTELSKKSLNRLFGFYKKDYKLLSRYYSRESIMMEHTACQAS